MRKLHIFSILAASLCWGMAPPGVLAQSEKKSPPKAYLNREDAGLEYQLQGEYRGWQRSLASDRSSRSVGLQVIDLGKGKFAASKYYDGLPGAGWRDHQRFEYHGELSGNIVRLAAADYTIEADGRTAVIFSRDGMRCGELKKVERVSPTMGAAPPPGAIVLFSGKPTDALVKPKITADGLLREGTQTTQAFGDMRLHLEFMLPFKPQGRGQDRGNSGVYVQGRYEVQVLDSYGLAGIENECGSIYRIKRPEVNMCLPPLTWQTYDIDFTMPRFAADGKKISNMEITIWQNGVLVQDRAVIASKTGAGLPEGPDPLPTKLQDHNNPVLYRNIWLIPKTAETSASSSWVKLPLSGPPTPLNQFSPPGLFTRGANGIYSITAQCR